LLEEKMGAMFSLRIMELCVALAIVRYYLYTTPYTIISMLVCMRIISFLIFAIYGYRMLGVLPSCNLSKRDRWIFLAIVFVLCILYDSPKLSHWLTKLLLYEN
jgi:hypothetical protein